MNVRRRSPLLSFAGLAYTRRRTAVAAESWPFWGGPRRDVCSSRRGIIDAADGKWVSAPPRSFGSAGGLYLRDLQAVAALELAG